MPDPRRRTTMALLAFLALVLPAGGASAEVWRVVGVSPVGDSLAVLAATLDPVQGYHRLDLVRLSLPDLAEQERTPLVDEARRTVLRKKGEYDLLRYEQLREKRRLLAKLVAQGYRTCRPFAVRTTPDPAPETHPGALRSPAERATVELPEGTGELVLTNEPGRGRVELRADGGSATVLGEVTLRDEVLSPYETVHYRLRGVRDVLQCDPWLVTLVETFDPPQPALPLDQHLVVRRLAPSTASDASAAR